MTGSLTVWWTLVLCGSVGSRALSLLRDHPCLVTGRPDGGPGSEFKTALRDIFRSERSSPRENLGELNAYLSKRLPYRNRYFGEYLNYKESFPL